VNRAEQVAATRARLLRAGERLFAERGIHQVRLREINALAGQRNSSALHYHFGSRDGLVEAILSEHQTAMDREVRPALDALTADGGVPAVRAVVVIWVGALTDQLQTESGRDFLRILPQVLDTVNRTVRDGAALRDSAASAQTFALLDVCLADLPTPVQRERLVAYALILTALFADRAALVESGAPVVLDDDEFAAHVTDVLCGALEAPTSISVVARRR
jgi:TetR/AcrR family transcriptional regulator, regulator of cefoperazone and chloramphenicol sensitivity